MNRVFGLLMGLAMAAAAQAQQPLRGRVLSQATGQPLAGLYVSVVDTTSGAIRAFEATDRDGRFVFRNHTHSPADRLVVKSRFYAESRQAVPAETAEELIIRLKERPVELAEHKVTASRPVVSRTGDTLRYKASGLATATDRVIGDVLRKIPGLEVADNGQIRYKGLPISNFFIDGDNVLDSRYGIATNNIAADVVDEVQLLENNQPVRALAGVVVPPNAALNITFKPGFRGQVLHNVTAGLGLPGVGLLEADQLVLRKQVKAVSYLKGNNTGRSYLGDHQAYDADDLRNEQQAGWQPDRLGINTLPDPPLKAFRYQFNATAALSTNLLLKTKPGDACRINAFGLTDRNHTAYRSELRLLDAATPYRYAENVGIDRRPRLAFGQLSFTRNRPRLYLNQELKAEQFLTDDRAAGPAGRQQLQGQARRLSHLLQAYHRRGRVLWQGSSFVMLAASPQALQTGSDSLPQPVGFHQFLQENLFFSRQQVGGTLVGSRTRFTLAAGMHHAYRRHRSALLGPDSTGRPVAGPANGLSLQSSKYFLLAQVFYQHQNHQLDLSLEPGYLSFATGPGGPAARLRRLYPQLAVVYRAGLPHQQGLRLVLTHRTDFPLLMAYYPQPYLRNYRTLYQPSRYDYTERQSELLAAYTFERSLELLFVQLTARLALATANAVPATRYAGGLMLSGYHPLANTRRQAQLGLNASKYLYRLRTNTTLKAGLARQQFGLFQQERLVAYQSLEKNLSVGLHPRQGRRLAFSNDAAFSHSRLRTADGPAFRVGLLKNTATATAFIGKTTSLSLTHAYVLYRARPGRGAVGNAFLDLSAQYKPPGRRYTLQLNAYNLLNRPAYYTRGTAVNFLTASEYRVRPLTVLAEAAFRF